MGVYPQKIGDKGSLYWIQRIVNEFPDKLNRSVGEKVDWLSPLKQNNFAEYRDSSFLNLLEINTLNVSLCNFWPNNGPQWDAMGKSQNRIYLIEAKSHLSENKSRCQASSLKSLKLIHQSLDRMAKSFGVPKRDSWLNKYYQYTNRLAHAYYLNELNSIPTTLVFLHFVNDKSMRGYCTKSEWEVGIKKLHLDLGLEKNIPDYVKNIFIDVSQID